MQLLLLSAPAIDIAGVSPQIAGMDSILDVARLLVPLFLMVCGGVILGRLFVLSEDTLVRVLTDLVTPLMVFHSLYRSSLSGATVLRLGGAALVVVAILSACAFIWTKVAGLDRRAYLPPILFYNTGFLGIPLMRLWGGYGVRIRHGGRFDRPWHGDHSPHLLGGPIFRLAELNTAPILKTIFRENQGAGSTFPASVITRPCATK